MANNLRKFNTYSDYEAAELVKPAVSLIAATDEVYFDQKDAPVPPTPSDFCRLTLNNGETVDIEGSGELTQEMISAYTRTCVSAEIGTLCTSIGGMAFYDCTSLTSIDIPDSVTSIGTSAFENCTSLTSVVIPSGVTIIGDGVFSSCSSLTSIDIPDSVTSIGDLAFGNCSNLTGITIPDSVTSIGMGTFDSCSGLISVVIPNSVITIGRSTFFNCISLTSCTIGSGVTSIGSEAFSGCRSLTSITSNAMTAPEISRDTFSNISSEGTLTVPMGSQDYFSWMDGYLPRNWRIEEV